MDKILNFAQAVKRCQQLRKQEKTSVLVGGVFDLLHYGHLQFLKAAKKTADLLIVALECDRDVRRKKGPPRPLQPERIRAAILAELACVDYVLILPEMKADKDYFNLVMQVRPAVIAVTEDDPQIVNKRRQAAAAGAKLAIVTARVPDYSTTRLAKILGIG